MLKRLLSLTYSKLVHLSVVQPFLYRHSLYIGQGAQDFWVFGEAFNQARGGYFVDVGAYDGIAHSNTCLLERRFGWNGICIEANPTTYQRLRAARRCVCVHACLDEESGKTVTFNLDDMSSGISDSKEPKALESQVSLSTQTLQNVLEQHNAPKVIDYCSVDIEGAEDRMLNGVDLQTYTFRAMTIERPSPAVKEKLARHGYLVVREIPRLDTFFIHESFVDQYRANCLAFNYKKFIALRWR